MCLLMAKLSNRRDKKIENLWLIFLPDCPFLRAVRNEQPLACHVTFFAKTYLTFAGGSTAVELLIIYLL